MVANANFNVVEDLQAVKASQFRSVSQENSYIQQGYIPIQTISELNMIREDTLAFTASYNNVTYTFEEYDEVETNNLNALKRNYILMNDLSFSEEDYTVGSGWLPIGNLEFKFMGKFYGNDKTISNLKIIRLNDLAESDNLGLFGYVKSDQLEIPSITKLTLEDPYIFGRDHVGALVGYLDNAKVDYIQIKSSYLIGDIASYLEIIQSETQPEGPIGGSIQGRTRVGGVVGRNIDGIVDNVINEATVGSYFDSDDFTSNRNGFIGGIVGGSTISDEFKIAQITNVVNHGLIFTIERNFVGGIVGGSGLLLQPFDVNMLVQNAINNGDIITIDYNLTESPSDPSVFSNGTNETVIGIGGIAGANGGIVSNVQNNGQIGSTRAQYVDIESYINDDGPFSAESQYEEYNGNNVGGIVGNNFLGAIVVSSKNYGNVYGSERVGGIVGSNSGRILLSSTNNPVINNSTVIKKVSGFESVGGIAGLNVDLEAANSPIDPFLNNHIQSVINEFDIYGVINVGGIVGTSFIANILRAANFGNIYGGDSAGGLVGDAYGVAIRESFNVGDINKVTTGEDQYYDPYPQEFMYSRFGGLIGDSDVIILESSFNMGDVVGVESSGGLIGYADDYTVLIENYHAGSTDTPFLDQNINSIGSLIGSFDTSYYIIIANISFESRAELNSIGEIIRSNNDLITDFENDYAIKIIDGNPVDDDFSFFLDNTPPNTSGGLDYFYRWNIDDDTYYQVWKRIVEEPFPVHEWFITYDDESFAGADESYPNYVYSITFDELGGSYIDSLGHIVETIDVDNLGKINFIEYAIALNDSDVYTIDGTNGDPEKTVVLRNNIYTNVIIEVENLLLSDLSANGIKLYAMTNAQYQTYLRYEDLSGVVSFDDDSGLDLVDFGINTTLNNSEFIIFEISDLAAPSDVYLIKLVYEDDRAATTLAIGSSNVRVHMIIQNFNPNILNIN